MSTIRRKNLISLIKDDFSGRQVLLAAKIDRPSSQVSDWVHGRRNMSFTMAREIESALGKTEGWLDSEQREDSPEGYVSLDLLDIQAAAGSGIVVSDKSLFEIVNQITVLDEWAKINLGKNIANIKIISAHGSSMQPRIKNGDILFVDTSITFYDGDGIYVIARENLLQVKRLQMLHGKILAVISDNKDFESEHLDGDAANSVKICGRVLYVLAGKKLW